MPIRSLAFLALLALASPPAAAEDDDRLPPWRDKVDQLVDRWADDVGSGRLMRAHTILIDRLRKHPEDGEALLALARVKLALPPLRLRDQHRAAKLAAENYESARRRADQAAEHLRLLLTDDKGKKVVLEKGGARHQAALAVGYLASQLLFRAEVRRRELIPNAPKRERLIAKHAAELARRRKSLGAACKDADQAAQRIQDEVRRLEFLRHIDRVGVFPRPLGLSDTAKKPIDLTAYRGKVLLIVFWSSKLEGTREVLQRIEKVRVALKGQPFEVLSINLDDRREALDKFLEKTPLPWRHAFGSTSKADGSKGAQPRGLASGVARAWSLRALPDGVLVDHLGRVRYLRPWEKDLQLKVQELLNRSKRRSS